MVSVRIEEAVDSDDAALRQLLREMPMPGLVQIAYLREPSFFSAVSVEGQRHNIIIGRDTQNGGVAGFGCRSVKSCYLNGAPAQVGYLSSLRVAPAYRNSTGLYRAFVYFRHLDRRNATVPFYLTTILESNRKARELLTSGRVGLPIYRDFGQYHSLAISSRCRRPAAAYPSTAICRATASDLPAILDFWQTEGARRQFFPVYHAADFRAGLLRDLALRDILIAKEKNRIIGTLGLWNQSGFKQSLVTGYARWFRPLRPMYNLVAPLWRMPNMPTPGKQLRFVYLAVPVVQDDSPNLFNALLTQALAKVGPSVSFVLAGFHERDPLLPIVKKLRHFAYPSRLYLVSWQEKNDPMVQLDNRVPYLELGGL